MEDDDNTKLACGEVATQTAVNGSTAGSNPAEPAKKPFNRNEYQREYMRKWRAEGKGYQRKTDGPVKRGRPRKVDGEVK